MKSPKSKSRAAPMPVPQTREEAADFLRQIGVSTRTVARIEADLNDQVAELKGTAEADAIPHRQLVESMTAGLRMWCEANRDKLTDGGKVKFAELGTGKVSWRIAPPKVWIKGVDAVVEALRKLGYKSMLRTKVEIDKEAMLKDPDKARLVPGVTIASGGEDFFCEPFEVSIDGGVA